MESKAVSTGVTLPAKCLASISVANAHGKGDSSLIDDNDKYNLSSSDEKDDLGQGVDTGSNGHQFIIGTSSASGDNMIRLIEYKENESSVTGMGTIQTLGSFMFDGSSESSAPRASKIRLGEVKALSPHPNSSTFENPIVMSVHQHGASVWKLKPAGASGKEDVIENFCHLPTPDLELGFIRSAKWNPTNSSKVIALHDGGLQLWDVNMKTGSSSTVQLKSKDKINFQGKFGACVWDPHQSNILAASCGGNIMSFDTRTSITVPSRSISNAHSPFVRDLDFNPNKPHFFSSCGDDGYVKFWDIRKDVVPVKILSGHNHWVTQTKYNPYHDQLLLTTSTDCSAFLWRVSSISSAPISDWEEHGHSTGGAREGPTAAEVAAAANEDMLLKRFDDHEDSIYACAWSASDAWVFATLSYDGKLFINHVPTAVKYSVIL